MLLVERERETSRYGGKRTPRLGDADDENGDAVLGMDDIAGGHARAVNVSVL